MTPRPYFAAAVSLIALAPMPGMVSSARAQSAVTSASADSDAIVVTARRRAEDIQKVPIAITAFSADTLVRKSIQSTGDLVKVTPGLNISGAGSMTNPFVTIRGQSKGLAGPGTPGVLTYFNEVPLPTSGSLISTFDMDSVQVLKGPQGTLFGRNAIGGAVLTYSKKPTYDVNGYFEGSYGNYHSLRLEGAVNMPIINDVLAVRVAAQSNSTDGFIKTNVYAPYQFVPGTSAFGVVPVAGALLNNQRRYDEYNTLNVRGSVLFEPAPWLHNTTVVDYSKVRGTNNTMFTGMNPLNPFPIVRVPTANLVGTPGAALIPILTPLFHCGTSPSCDIEQAITQAASNVDKRIANTDEPADATTRLFGITNTTVLDIGENMSLKNIFGYRRVKTEQGTDIDGSALPVVGTANLVHLKQFSDELQLSGSAFDNRLKYVVGGIYFKSSPNGYGGFQGLRISVFGGLNDSQAVNYLSEQNKALYGQVDFQIVPSVTATAGYRYSWDQASGCSYAADYSITNGGKPYISSVEAPMPSEAQCVAKAFLDPRASPGRTSFFTATPSKFEKGTYTFALNWQATDSILLYATTRRGYRSGGFNSPTLDARVSNLQNFAPETLTDYEFGTKGRYELGGIRGSFNLAYFIGKDKGYQYYQTTTGIGYLPNGGVLVNKADLTIEGYEAELNVTPIEGLTLGANVAFTSIKVDKVTIPATLRQAFVDAGANTAVLDIISVPNQPKWQYNLNLDWQAAHLAGGDLRVGADFHHQTKFRSGEIDVPGYSTLDARITLANLNDGTVDVSIWGKNITDETYYNGSASSASGTGAVSYIMAPPATYGATIRYRFGG